MSLKFKYLWCISILCAHLQMCLSIGDLLSDCPPANIYIYFLTHVTNANTPPILTLEDGTGTLFRNVGYKPSYAAQKPRISNISITPGQESDISLRTSCHSSLSHCQMFSSATSSQNPVSVLYSSGQ